MKLKRVLALFLAVVLLACIPAVHAEEIGNSEIVGFEIINEDELPELVWNSYYSMQEAPATASGIWNLDKKVKFLVTFADGSTEIVTYLDSVNGESITHSYDLSGVGTDNRIIYSLAGLDAVCNVTIIESPVDHIELVSEPDPLVVGEDAVAIKIGAGLGITSNFNACYEGLSVMVYYKDGTSELIKHEELDFGNYPEGTRNFYTFPEHNGYSVEVQVIPYDDYAYWTGNFVDPTGVIRMYIHYMGQLVEFDLTVVDGPVAKVVLHPLDTTVKEGTTANFFAGITGPNMTYQWQYRSGENEPWYDLEWATEAEIYLDVELEISGYQFRCVGTDENGVVAYTDPATLTVVATNKIENYSLEELYTVNDLVLGADGVYRTQDDRIVYIGLNNVADGGLTYLSGETLYNYIDVYGEQYFDVTYWEDLVALMDDAGYVVLTENSLTYFTVLITGNPNWGEDESFIPFYLFFDKEASPAQQQKNGWVQEDGVWYYYQNSTKQTGWVSVNGTWYYLDSNGAMQTGWEQVNGVWYYLDGTGAMQTGWEQINGVWYYLDSNGAMQTGWEQVNGVWYYLDASGAMQTGWVQVGGKWYYLNAGGAMQTGWIQDGGKWYYLNTSGVMQTGWQHIDGKWYYLNSEMQTGWQHIDGKWYYLNSEMKTGWQYINGKWYYLNSAMHSGWLQLGGKWYYLGYDGAMVTGTQVIGGVTYYFDSNGVWIP